MKSVIEINVTFNIYCFELWPLITILLKLTKACNSADFNSFVKQTRYFRGPNDWIFKQLHIYIFFILINYCSCKFTAYLWKRQFIKNNSDALLRPEGKYLNFRIIGTGGSLAFGLYLTNNSIFKILQKPHTFHTWVNWPQKIYRK